MLENLKNKKILIITVIVIIILLTQKILDSKNNYNQISTTEDNLMEVTEEKKVENAETIVIHIIGAVKKPGIVKLPEGSRIEDAIELAGGLNEDADITNVNLAYVLDDGVKLKIPSTEDEFIDQEDYISKDNGNGIILEKNNSNESSNVININKATQIELETLTGIGPSIAEKIIEYREKNGNFKNIEDIKNVSGIGENKFEEIKNNIEI